MTLMATLEVDVDTYLARRKIECTKLNIMEPPEVEHITDIEKKNRAAKLWIKGRHSQLENLKGEAFREFDKAYMSGFLELEHYVEARKKCSKMYKEVTQASQKEYKRIIELRRAD